MEEELPSEFELVVVGTGMVESIVAAAASRIGKSVLHVDANDHYGGLWASYNFEGLQKLIKDIQNEPLKHSQINNLAEKWYIEDEGESQELTEELKSKCAIDPNKKWTKKDIFNYHRKFNIDLTPKLLFARGPLVELLISSNIARYAEFRCVSRVLTWLNDSLVHVPCSRADVFATADVSVIEKRMLMQLLTTFVNVSEEQIADEFKDWKDKQFREYLEHKKLTPHLTHYVLYAIAGGANDVSCLDGVKECKKFLMSLGRYGNTPFLWPMYGSGELPQCFCRLCAVFGGVYCLNRPIDKVTAIEKDGKKGVAIDTKSKTITCENLVIGIDESPKDLIMEEPADNGISKAVFISNGSIMPSEKESLSLVRFPPLEGGSCAVTVIEVGPSTGSCPPGLFVVYFITRKSKDAQSDLLPYAEKLFDLTDGAAAGDAKPKPKPLWSLFFNIKDTSSPVKSSNDNIYITSGPDAALDFDKAVEQAEQIFRKICPDSEFLPRAPDPEEIVFDEEVPTGPQFEGDKPDQ